MEEILDDVAIPATAPLNKIYNVRMIQWGTFLGGPLVAGYFIAENFKAFNNDDKASWTWLCTIIATIAIFTLAMLIPHNDRPGLIFAACEGAIAYYIAKQFQGNAIDAHINAGGQAYSGWRVFAIALIGAVITFTIFVIIYLVMNLKGH